MQKIKVRKSSRFAKVDDEDFSYLNQHNWTLSWDTRGEFPCRYEKGKRISMHNDIYPNHKVFHKDGDLFNNQKHNLIAKKMNNVSWYPKTKKWRVIINRKHIGYYKTKKEALKKSKTLKRQKGI